ncbi:hypothetical protein A3F34_01715 [Candidatus Roizmanbacteria bacterium RIFCSPHIGHO2_12_FULL_44_10]|uniref:Aspartate/glutamate/uridylate kinase domain-containing protein n=1 Tax=Candidatus Roizmanbacteria bacterium RIFCSPHIGHO2_12_FULL_44_10 TaxID=1802054 RepID=A0A1F7IB34_9BACT|nr:MAG: hypothetical protein A3F34_01715 [Candidatus Roizmanbacteria bacterium RIFCSPHIGHO2_12_FULL_44_10]
MIILKVGGGKNIRWDYIAEDVFALLKKQPVVIVHGANAIRDEIANRLSQPVKRITSPSGIESTYTDKVALEIMLMTYAGIANKTIVAKLLGNQIPAVGLTGVDGKLWEAKRKRYIYMKDEGKTKLISDSYTGRVEKVNSKLIRTLIRNKYVPVICPPAISFDNEIVNTDNDWAVMVMASALKVKEIVMLFEAPGLLKNFGDESSLIRKVSCEELHSKLEHSRGTMKKKILGAEYALKHGVRKIYWGDGRIKNPVINAMKGNGTVIS